MFIVSNWTATSKRLFTSIFSDSALLFSNSIIVAVWTNWKREQVYHSNMAVRCTSFNRFIIVFPDIVILRFSKDEALER